MIREHATTRNVAAKDSSGLQAIHMHSSVALLCDKRSIALLKMRRRLRRSAKRVSLHVQSVRAMNVQRVAMPNVLIRECAIANAISAWPRFAKTRLASCGVVRACACCHNNNASRYNSGNNNIA